MWAPLPTEPLRENVEVPVLVIVQYPLAAVFPPTPLMFTLSPFTIPCEPITVITMGVAFVAPVMIRFAPTACSR